MDYEIAGARWHDGTLAYKKVRLVKLFEYPRNVELRRYAILKNLGDDKYLMANGRVISSKSMQTIYPPVHFFRSAKRAELAGYTEWDYELREKYGKELGIYEVKAMNPSTDVFECTGAKFKYSKVKVERFIRECA